MEASENDWQNVFRSLRILSIKVIIAFSLSQVFEQQNTFSLEKKQFALWGTTLFKWVTISELILSDQNFEKILLKSSSSLWHTHTLQATQFCKEREREREKEREKERERESERE